MLTVLYIEPCTLYHEQSLKKKKQKKEKKRGGDKVKEERERYAHCAVH